MSCDFPIAAYLRKDVNPSGKRSYQFVSRGSLSGQVHYLPCGRCTGCRLERSRVWAVRCVHEAKMHRDNCFLTLTYDNDHLPADWSISVRELQLFMKKLRTTLFRLHGVRVRFYACGEYGDTTQRPHYHILLFGYDFGDKRLYSSNARGDNIYTSAFLDALWGKGQCKIGEVNFETAAYVARYCMKKVSGKERDAGHYMVITMDGEITERVPEFALMSRRPGIGATYYEKYGKEIRTHDSIIMNGQEIPSIRYYDKRFEAIDPEGLKRVKRKRHPVLKIGREKFLTESRLDRRIVKAKLKDAAVRQKKREL